MDAEHPTALAVEPGELGGDRFRPTHLALADRFDLPTGAVGFAPASGVGSVTFDGAVLRVDVELDAPPRHGDTEVEVDGPAIGSTNRDLWLDRYAAPPQSVSEDDLRVRLVRGRAAERLERPTEPTGAGPSRMGEPTVDGPEILERDVLLVEHLVDHRSMVERSEVGGEVEGEPRPRREGDPVVPGDAVRIPDDRRLAPGDAGERWQVDAVGN
jgi:hypothetical protein